MMRTAWWCCGLWSAALVGGAWAADEGLPALGGVAEQRTSTPLWEVGIGAAVLEIAALSFLGLAAVAPQSEWGFMIGIERNQMFTSPLLVLIPGIMLTLTVLGFNLLGDGLRDAFDPRLTR